MQIKEEIKIISIYILLGSLWILYSDKFITANFTNPQIINQIQTIKGWIFVMTSAIIFYYIIHKSLDELREKNKSKFEALNKEYEIIFNNTHDAQFLIDVEDNTIKYQRLSKSHEKLTGLTTEQVKGKSPINIFGEDIGKELLKNYQNCINKKRIISYEEELQLPSGKQHFHTILVPVIDKGKVTHIVGSGRDITERIGYEEELKKEREKLAYSKLKTQFFTNISHELKTPLNLIFSALQIMESYKINQLNLGEDKRLNKYSKIIKQNSFRLLKIVNNLIDITKIDSDYFELNLKNNDIVDIVKKITFSVKEYIDNKKRRLIFNSSVSEKIISCDSFNIERNYFESLIKCC